MVFTPRLSSVSVVDKLFGVLDKRTFPVRDLLIFLMPTCQDIVSQIDQVIGKQLTTAPGGGAVVKCPEGFGRQCFTTRTPCFVNPLGMGNFIRWGWGEEWGGRVRIRGRDTGFERTKAYCSAYFSVFFSPHHNFNPGCAMLFLQKHKWQRSRQRRSTPCSLPRLLPLPTPQSPLPCPSPGRPVCHPGARFPWRSRLEH